MSKNGPTSGSSNIGRPSISSSEAGKTSRPLPSKSGSVTPSSVTNNRSRIASQARSMSTKERSVTPSSGPNNTNRLASNASSISNKKPSTPSPANARTVVGRIRNPIKIQPGTNKPETIGGRKYSGHALDRMQGRGLYPSVVENAIKTGKASPGRKGRTEHFDPKNNLRVITNTNSGRVVTTYNTRKGKS